MEGGARTAALLRQLEWDAPREEPEVDVIEVMPANWMIVQVWLRCQPTYAGMGSQMGVAAMEVQAVCIALGKGLTTDMLDGVQYMASIAANIVNDAHAPK